MHRIAWYNDGLEVTVRLRRFPTLLANAMVQNLQPNHQKDREECYEMIQIDTDCSEHMRQYKLLKINVQCVKSILNWKKTERRNKQSFINI